MEAFLYFMPCPADICDTMPMKAFRTIGETVSNEEKVSTTCQHLGKGFEGRIDAVSP